MVPHKKIQTAFSEEDRTDAGGAPNTGSTAAAWLCRGRLAHETGLSGRQPWC